MEEEEWSQGRRCHRSPSPQSASSWQVTAASWGPTHAEVLLKMQVETYFSGRLLTPVKKTLELFAVNGEEKNALHKHKFY